MFLLYNNNNNNSVYFINLYKKRVFLFRGAIQPLAALPSITLKLKTNKVIDIKKTHETAKLKTKREYTKNRNKNTM